MRINFLKFPVLLCTFFYHSANAQLSCAGKTTSSFSFTGGVQTWTVPAGVTSITIKTQGATGGLAPATGNFAGGGAIMEADYTVIPGQVVTILVGGRGVNGNDNEAGGGGATGVYIAGVLKLVAGGGGGEDNTGNGDNGQATINGSSSPVDNNSNCTCSRPVNGLNGLGGTGGAGGNHGEFCAACTHGGGGGGGFSSAGQGNGNVNAGQPGAQGNILGAAGGIGSADDAVGVNGGWGWAGGGGADDRESGGGGGYSGGGGGPEGFNPGGGGSFSDATNRTASFTANGTSTTTAADGIVTICHASVLPLTLVNFSGISSGNCNTLNWTTLQENNINRFVIERSSDGINFNNIGETTATNTSLQKEYQFTDCSINNSIKWYYRIRIADNNGSFKFSPVIKIIKGGRSIKFSLTPNPATDKIFINSSQAIQKIEIINSTGAVLIIKNKINLTDPVLINNISSGVYILRAYTADEILVSKFVKK